MSVLIAYHTIMREHACVYDQCPTPGKTNVGVSMPYLSNWNKSLGHKTWMPYWYKTEVPQ